MLWIYKLSITYLLYKSIWAKCESIECSYMDIYSISSEIEKKKKKYVYKMTRYVNVKVNITEGQREKLQHAIKAGCSAVSIHLGHEDLQGNDILAVTNSQAKKLAKAHQNGKGITIRMTSKQLKRNTKIEGGFLGLLAGLAARALSMKSWCSFRVSLMGLGLYLKKGGCISQVETDGQGLYLKPYKGIALQSYGDGLYLKQGGKLYDGKGLLLGPNSPFTNIPSLGAIL